MDNALVENVDVLVAVEDAMAAMVRSIAEDAWEDCVGHLHLLKYD
jgi:hypothetical protein